MLKRSRGVYFKNDTYRAGNAWFTCDICSGRYRRSLMLTQWDGLKVDSRCYSIRPPQMTPPNIYPEGLPFFDARPPQDLPDRLQDDTYLQSVPGGIVLTQGQINNQGPGALSPRNIITGERAYLATEDGTPITTEDGQLIYTDQVIVPQGANVLEDDITLITGPQWPPTNEGAE